MASVTASTFATAQETLSDELIKDSGLVQAQNDFRFDEAARTLIVDVASVFRSDSRENRDTLAYGLATEFAPVFWGPQVTDNVRPESTVLFQVKVDDLTYTCQGPSMVALADRELSQERFLEQCAS